MSNIACSKYPNEFFFHSQCNRCVHLCIFECLTEIFWNHFGIWFLWSTLLPLLLSEMGVQTSALIIYSHKHFDDRKQQQLGQSVFMFMFAFISMRSIQQAFHHSKGTRALKFFSFCAKKKNSLK